MNDVLKYDRILRALQRDQISTQIVLAFSYALYALWHQEGVSPTSVVSIELDSMQTCRRAIHAIAQSDLRGFAVPSQGSLTQLSYFHYEGYGEPPEDGEVYTIINDLLNPTLTLAASNTIFSR